MLCFSSISRVCCLHPHPHPHPASPPSFSYLLTHNLHHSYSSLPILYLQHWTFNLFIIAFLWVSDCFQFNSLCNLFMTLSPPVMMIQATLRRIVFTHNCPGQDVSAGSHKHPSLSGFICLICECCVVYGY